MSDDHLTPDFLAMLFEGWFDPCPYPRPTWNGLEIPWKDKTYANIPYSRRKVGKPGPEAWVRKAIKESESGKRIALLVRHDHTTNWWAEAYNAGGHFLPIMERVQFKGEGPSPNFLSTLILFAPTKSVFECGSCAEVFHNKPDLRFHERRHHGWGKGWEDMLAKADKEEVES